MLKTTARHRTKPQPKARREVEVENGEGADDITDKICTTLAGAVAERAFDSKRYSA